MIEKLNIGCCCDFCEVIYAAVQFAAKFQCKFRGFPVPKPHIVAPAEICRVMYAAVHSRRTAIRRKFQGKFRGFPAPKPHNVAPAMRQGHMRGATMIRCAMLR